MNCESIKEYELNNRPIWRGMLSKMHGEQLKSPTDYVIRLLVPSDADKMGALSAEIYHNLSIGQECFIHKHEKAYYHQSFREKDLYYIGVFAHNRLIGMSYLRVCKNKEQVISEIPGCSEQALPVSSEKPVAAFGADSILPAYRGNRLNQMMIQFRLNLAKKLGCGYAASIIDRQNHWNMSPYFENGFRMFGSAVDPADNGKIALMSFNMKRLETRKEALHIWVSYRRTKLIDRALAFGFEGVGFDTVTRNILFEASPVHVKKITRHPTVVRSLMQRLQQKEYGYV